MKKLLYILFMPLLVSGIEYEFLTPQYCVVKGKNVNPAGLISSQYRADRVWKKENALLRDKKGRILRKPDITFYQYIKLARPLKHGETVRLSSKAVLRYDKNIPSSAFKLNQLGNGMKQKRKYAYLGAWLGQAGALPLKHLAGKSFELRRVSDDKCVYSNVLTLRKEDSFYQGKIPFTGEEVLALDYSSFNTPGKYYFYVDSIGRSMDFSIGAETLNEAFYIHARGLYHKRCGIEKKQPFTAWESPACHFYVYRGRFPGNAEHYRKAHEKRDYGFFDIKNNSLEVKVFDLIKEYKNHKKDVLFAPGGWHDAADYDRRPYHLRIVSDLAAVYLMKSGNFTDDQLNIPESGNGIPDILDEAAWGLKHLLAVQENSGGVGSWFETTCHPGPGEGMPDKEKRAYFISAPGRNSSLEYAAAASTLALAMKKAAAVKESEKYLRSAKKAWAFAMKPKNSLVGWYFLNGKLVSYSEEPFLDAESLLRAGANLYVLTGKSSYLDRILKEEKRLKESFNRDFWKWSVLSLMPLELHSVKELETFRREYRTVVLRNAEKMLDDQENAYSYRTLWHSADAGWVHAMAWGNYHPLRRAMTLIAAHKLTGDERFLQGAYLANDFHNGANPLGRTMTSGLGRVYPAAFLDLISYANKTKEFVPGITPYGNTFGLDRKAVEMVYADNAEKLPIFRRCVNLEFLSVPSSEYSVWETIAPAAVTTGYLIEKPAPASEYLKKRQPAADFRQLPGYHALP